MLSAVLVMKENCMNKYNHIVSKREQKYFLFKYSMRVPALYLHKPCFRHLPFMFNFISASNHPYK